MSVKGFDINGTVEKYDYDALDNKPTIPTVPTKVSDLTNDSGFVDAAGALDATLDWVSANETIAEVEAAYQANKILFVDYSGRIYVLDKRSSSTNYTFSSVDDSGVLFLNRSGDTWSASSKSWVSVSNSTPAALGTAAAGSSGDAARADHVHAMPSASDVGAIADPMDSYQANEYGARLAWVYDSLTHAASWQVCSKPWWDYDVDADAEEFNGNIVFGFGPEINMHFIGNIISLNVSFLDPSINYGEAPHYRFTFLSGSTAPTLTLPNNVVMPSGFSVQANMRYEIDICFDGFDGTSLGTGYGVYMSWPYTPSGVS